MAGAKERVCELGSGRARVQPCRKFIESFRALQAAEKVANRLGAATRAEGPNFIAQRLSGFENPLPRTKSPGLHPDQRFSAACLAPEGICYQCTREFGGEKKRTSVAKAGYGNVIYGTAEPVPFQDRVLTHALKPNLFQFVYGPTKVVP